MADQQIGPVKSSSVDPALSSDLDAVRKGLADDLKAAKTPPPSSPSWMDAVLSQLKDVIPAAVESGPIGQTAAMGNAVLHPIDTAKGLLQQNQDLYDQAHQAFTSGDYATGVVKSVKYLINGTGLGSLLDQSSQDLSEGKIGKFAGTMLGMGTTLKAPQVLSEKLYPAVEAAIKARQAKAQANAGAVTADLVKAVPPSKAAAYGPDDVNRAAPYLASEHANSPINSVEALRDASDSAVTQIEEHVGKYIAANPTDTIRTNPLEAARRVLLEGERGTDLPKGLLALKDLGLDKPLTLVEADAKRLRLNAENKAVLLKNKYDVATARKVDPKFAAREAAAKALRDGIYDQLESRGIEGVRELRRDEGSLLTIRDAAERQIYTGKNAVAGTGSTGARAQMTRIGVPAATTAAGEMVMGLPGAIAGGAIGNQIAKHLAPGNLTRDALVDRAFKSLKVPRATFPDVPPPSQVRGLIAGPQITLGGAPDTSFVRGVPAQRAPLNPARLLGPGERPIILGPSPDTSTVRGVSADRGLVVRDPKTGRYKRVYTGEIK